MTVRKVLEFLKAAQQHHCQLVPFGWFDLKQPTLLKIMQIELMNCVVILTGFPELPEASLPIVASV
jgi:hypothetical protein